MTLEAFYREISGDYGEVLSRLIKEERIEKYVLKFLNDPSYETLAAAYEAKNYEEAFRAVHTLKGVSQNLGFPGLYRSSDALTEALRNNGIPSDDRLMEEVSAAYRMTVQAIEGYRKEAGKEGS